MRAQDQPPSARVPRGPKGEVLTHENLPAPRQRRWVVRRKAEIVIAVDCGLLSVEEACSRYGLTLDEFLSPRFQRISRIVEQTIVARHHPQLGECLGFEAVVADLACTREHSLVDAIRGDELHDMLRHTRVDFFGQTDEARVKTMLPRLP